MADRQYGSGDTGVFERICAYLDQTGRPVLTARQLRRSRRTASRRGMPIDSYWYLVAMATGNRQGLAELQELRHGRG